MSHWLVDVHLAVLIAIGIAPTSLCNRVTENAHTNCQMHIASVVSGNPKKNEDELYSN